jgi:hypothetical protein
VSRGTLEILVSAKDTMAVQLNRQWILNNLKFNGVLGLMKITSIILKCSKNTNFCQRYYGGSTEPPMDPLQSEVKWYSQIDENDE